MSSKFKKRLKQLHGSRQRRRRDDSAPEKPRVFTADNVEATPPRIGEVAAKQSEAAGGGVENQLPSVIDRWRKHGAQSRTTDRGDAHFTVRHHPRAHQHGHFCLEEGTAVTLDCFRKQLNDARLHSADPARLVFLDLETNGLSKTSFPFCIGIGLWEGSSFAVYHYFTPAEDDEPAALEACAEILRDCAGLCTFNGSSFDVRMLVRRFRHHKIDHPLDDIAHLDLLHLARKLLPDRNGHKLSQLEEDVLGFGRTGDVPGAKIPGRWKRYLKTGNPELLLDVFDHNRLDILSMVVLLAALAPGQDALPPKQGVHFGGSASSAGQDKPQSKLAARLSRTYALRKKANSSKPRKAEPTEGERDSVKLKGSFSRSRLREGMPIGTRLRELRGEVEQLLGAGQDEKTLPKLHEMVALAPRNPFALEKLVEHYRRSGEQAVADHFAKRLEESSPY